jgi:hypothetical protein
MTIFVHSFGAALEIYPRSANLRMEISPATAISSRFFEAVLRRHGNPKKERPGMDNFYLVTARANGCPFMNQLVRLIAFL